MLKRGPEQRRKMLPILPCTAVSVATKSVLLLTSALHMPRSMQFFERYLGEQGVKVAAYPCDYTLNPQGKFNPRWLVPQLQAFDVTCMALHEYVGMAGAFLQR